MSRHCRSSRVYAFPAVLQLIAFLTSCTNWQVQPAASPRDLVATERPHVVRVTRSDSSRVVLNDPSVQGDTLYGTPATSDTARTTARISVPLSEITDIAVRRTDPNRTTVFAVGLGITVLSALCLAESLVCEPDEVIALLSGLRSLD
jgi:hypothetical protein